MGFLGKEVNDTKAWTEISQTLVEAGKQLRMVLPVIKLDKNETRGKYGKGVGAGQAHTPNRGRNPADMPGLRPRRSTES